jgi:alkylation response protein AidB-like acyl-CoA dehydrogenase
VNFDLTEDQKVLRDTAASFAKKSSPVDRKRDMAETDLGYETSVWRQMGELGWLGVLFPESVGGYGGTMVDAALIIEQFAKTLVPEPYLASVVLGGMTVLRAGNAEHHKRWLEPLCEGKTSLALAYAERHSRFDTADVRTTATKSGDGWKLAGEKVWVLNGHAADTIVVSAATDGGVSLFAVDRDANGLAIQSVATMDGNRAAMVTLDGVEVGADRLLGEPGQGASVLDEVMDLGAAAACAEGVGICQTVLDMTVDYLKTREQFGVKIGAFQVLQHRAVDMFIETQLCRSQAIEAAIRCSDGSDAVTRSSAVSAAKVQLAVGGKYVVQQGTQLHGGIAITEEHDMGLYFKRMHILNTLFGDEDHHLHRYAALPSFTDGLRA